MAQTQREQLKETETQQEKRFKFDFGKRESAKGQECMYCGALCSSTAQICPECGMSLMGDKCTFCGAPLHPGADHCDACGCPTDGIECPTCGTINFRGFCRKCNMPLNTQSNKALATLRLDPKFKEAETISLKLDKFEEIISKLENGEATDEDSETVMELFPEMDFEIDIHSHLNREMPEGEVPSDNSGSVKQNGKPKKVERRQITFEEAVKIYEQEKQKMDDLLNSIVPPPEFTPEEQRDFCSARLYAVKKRYTKIVDQRDYWVCNFCGARHHAPQECAEPWHGGKWITRKTEITYDGYSLESK